MATLDVAIIGAGIAGLTAAAALARAGHDVAIYERSSFSNEVGAAIHVCPNAAKVLAHFGFDFVRSQAVVVRKGSLLNGKTLAPIYSGSYADLKAQYGAEWYFMHRVDLHNELRRVTLQPDDCSKAAKLHLNKEVVAVDCESGMLTFADGSKVQRDLIVVADGIHSRFIRKVAGEDTPLATETGQSAFRFMIPSENILDIDLPAEMFTANPASLTIATDGVRRLVVYPCRGGQLQNCVAIHPDRPHDEAKEGWNIEASLPDLLDEYKDFHPELVKLMRQATDLKLWRLLYRSPNPTWYTARTCLVGDACHPMLPHQGQGGGQAIEDGGALGALFADLKTGSRAEIEARLNVYQDVRSSRAAAIQIFSNAGQDEGHKIKAEAERYVQGPIPSNQEEFMKFNFSSDVVAECKARLVPMA